MVKSLRTAYFGWVKKKTTNLQKCRLLWNQINKQYNFIQLHHVLCPPFDVYLNNKHHKMRWTAKRNHLNFENQKKNNIFNWLLNRNLEFIYFSTQVNTQFRYYDRKLHQVQTVDLLFYILTSKFHFHFSMCCVVHTAFRFFFFLHFISYVPLVVFLFWSLSNNFSVGIINSVETRPCLKYADSHT